MSNDIKKSLLITSLFDHYQNLLTDKQKKYIELYYFENLSLSEIAEEFNVSRAAIADGIKKAEEILIDIEGKLFINKNHELIQNLLNLFKDEKISKSELISKIEEVI